ncbi:HNH endonuclease signature motif containing protein [Bacillaceae bacterium S4-13-58]
MAKQPQKKQFAMWIFMELQLELVPFHYHNTPGFDVKLIGYINHIDDYGIITQTYILKGGTILQTNKVSRNISEPIKREVRQRCGFGCVICGFPLYEYDHMKEWAVVHEHIADDLTLLCDKHHKEVTNGLLPREKVLEANQNPFNLQEKRSSPMLLHYQGNTCEVEIGGNKFTTQSNGEITQLIPVLVDGIPIINFIIDSGNLLLNMVVFDQYNSVVLQIVNNELLYNTSPWDIVLEGKRLSIREKARKFLISMIFEPPNKIIIDKARLLCNGVEILVKPEYILLTNNKNLISGCKAINTQGGLIIGNTPIPIGGFMSIQGVNRYLGDSSEAVKWAKEMLND